jgi:putative membrane protein
MEQISNTPEAPENLAKDRTELAQERTILATERTFSAWVRTGLAAMVTGLGVVHLLEVPSMPWATPLMGSILVLLGGGIYVIAFYRYSRLLRKVTAGRGTAFPIWLSAVLTALLLLTILIALVIIIQKA